ncbi:hypothetical protein L7F22_038261 [Adiantum nelumboides]|nr:hypothetical protein [Adiantum nelumboides]
MESAQLLLEYLLGLESAMVLYVGPKEQLVDMPLELAASEAILEVEISQFSFVVVDGDEFIFLHNLEKEIKLRMDECLSVLKHCEKAQQLGHNYIGSKRLLLGLLREGEGVAARVFENLGADPNNIRTQVIYMVGESTKTVGASVGGGSSNGKMPTLKEFGTNLTKLADDGQLDLVVGREPQIERVTHILRRKTNNNPCLIGDPGVGKATIAKGLAQQIASGDVPKTIEGKKVITLDMGLPAVGTKYRGEFEEAKKAYGGDQADIVTIDNLDHIIDMVVNFAIKESFDVDTSFTIEGEVPCARNIEDKPTEVLGLNTSENLEMIIRKSKAFEEIGDAFWDIGDKSHCDESKGFVTRWDHWK